MEQKVLMIIRELSEGDSEVCFSGDDILDAFANSDHTINVTKKTLRKILRDFELNIVLVKQTRGGGSKGQWSVKNMGVLHCLINDNLEDMVKKEEIDFPVPSPFNSQVEFATL